MPLKDPEAHRAYHAKYMKEVWYPKNRKKHIAYTRRNVLERKARLAEVVNEIKNVPCADCKQRFHPIAMDFDHMPGEEKKYNISALVASGYPLERVQAEMSKCEIVCSNCHRIRTLNRRVDKTLSLG